MNRTLTVGKPIVVLIAISCMGVISGGSAVAQENSIEGIWGSDIEVDDSTITRRLIIDAEESNLVDDVLTETGNFRYERTNPNGRLLIEGTFRHVFEDGRGVIDLRSGERGLRFGRRFAIDEIDRPAPDSLRIEFIIWQGVSCSSAIGVDGGDILFTREDDDLEDE